VLAQGHQRKQADDAGDDQAGFQDAGGDKAERGAFVLPLDYRVQRDGGADAGRATITSRKPPASTAVWPPEPMIQSRWFFTGP